MNLRLFVVLTILKPLVLYILGTLLKHKWDSQNVLDFINWKTKLKWTSPVAAAGLINATARLMDIWVFQNENSKHFVTERALEIFYLTSTRLDHKRLKTTAHHLQTYCLVDRDIRTFVTSLWNFMD